MDQRRGTRIILRVSRQSSVAIFFVRVWYEDGEFRARVSQSADLTSERPVDLWTAEPSDLEQLLATWLREIDQRQGDDA